MSAYLSFIVHNYDRLPVAVAFGHGHQNVQGFYPPGSSRSHRRAKPGQREDYAYMKQVPGLDERCIGLVADNAVRLKAVTPFVHEDMFVYYGVGKNYKRKPKANLTCDDPIFQAVWGAVTGESSCSRDKPGFQIGAHFVVGRARIRRRPRALYESLLRFGLGETWYPGADGWYDTADRAQIEQRLAGVYGPGHMTSASFWLEPLWPKLFEGDDTIPDSNTHSLSCRLGFTATCGRSRPVEPLSARDQAAWDAPANRPLRRLAEFCVAKGGALLYWVNRKHYEDGHVDTLSDFQFPFWPANASEPDSASAPFFPEDFRRRRAFIPVPTLKPGELMRQFAR